MAHENDPVPAAAEDDAASPLTPGVVRILAENHRAFLGFLERRVGRKDLAEDILQEAFVRSIGKVAALRDETSAVAWFYAMLRHAVIDHRRRGQARERALDAFAKEMEGAEEPLPDVEAAVCGCVAQLTKTLKPEYAAALQRIEVDGVPVKAFAEEQGISAGNAAVRVFRAREALRRQVGLACGTCAQHGCLDCTCGPKAPAIE